MSRFVDINNGSVVVSTVNRNTCMKRITHIDEHCAATTFTNNIIIFTSLYDTNCQWVLQIMKKQTSLIVLSLLRIDRKITV